MTMSRASFRGKIGRTAAGAWLWRFCRNENGLSAVEFALIVPVMLTLYFATLETTDALTASRRVTNVAQTAADLVAQATAVSSSDLTDIYAASAAILSPYDTTAVKITITSVVASSSNVTTVAWSASYNGTARTAGAAITVPTGLTTANTSVIMAEVTYTYTSPIGTFITGPITMSEVAYLRPRRSLTVSKT
jgi:Flp pilus assembly protein TadG